VVGRAEGAQAQDQEGREALRVAPPVRVVPPVRVRLLVQQAKVLRPRMQEAQQDKDRA